MISHVIRMTDGPESPPRVPRGRVYVHDAQQSVHSQRLLLLKIAQMHATMLQLQEQM
jgi:hypothetical protein